MSLLKDIAALKSHFGTVNENMAYETVQPHIEQSEVAYIIPFISQAFFDELETAYNATPTAEQQKAITRIQRALAFYSIYELMPVLNVAISDMGVQNLQSKEGTSNSATQWSFKEARKNARESGDRFMDHALAFLETNKADYPTWTASAAYTIYKELFINTAEEFNRYIFINSSRRSFLKLKPYIIRAEEKYIRPILCDELMSEIKTQIKANTVTADNQIILDKIKCCLPGYAMFEAFEDMTFLITADGMLTFSSNDGVDMTKELLQRQDNAKSNYINTAKTFAASLKDYLDEHVATYPLYQNSKCYTQYGVPDTNIPDNRNRKSFMT